MTAKKLARINWMGLKRGLNTPQSVLLTDNPFGGLDNHHEKSLPPKLKALCRRIKS